ncbi:MAG: DUF2628 domain-containing protein [Alphaproteobacteria bacterium]|nr:DUF2628 domain-containing protein [Alphaproteobacteria bacterium]
MTIPAQSETGDWKNDDSLSEIWKFRFRFFDTYGVPEAAGISPELMAGFKALSLVDRIRLAVNGYAFFFTFLYIAFVLKLWRQGVVLFAIAVGFLLLAAFLNLSEPAMHGLLLGYCICVALRANSLYYICRTQGDIGWKI